MSAEADLFAALTRDTAVAALVSARIYPNVAPEEAALPLVAYERTATDEISTIHGGPPVASKVEISASAWARTRLAAEAIADAMVVAVAQLALCTNRFSHFDEPTGLHASVIALEIWER